MQTRRQRRQTTHLLFSTRNWSGFHSSSNLRSGSIFVSLCAVRENVWEPVKLGLISGYSSSTSRLTLPPALICTSQKQAVNKSWTWHAKRWMTIAPIKALFDFCCEVSRVTVIFPSHFYSPLLPPAFLLPDRSIQIWDQKSLLVGKTGFYKCENLWTSSPNGQVCFDLKFSFSRCLEQVDSRTKDS